MNTRFRCVNKVSLLKTIVGVSIACFSIYAFIFSSPFGIIPIAISLVLLQTEGSEINIASKKYRKIYSILGADFGKWKDIPDIEYVSVFGTNENIAVWASSASANIKNEVFKLNLFYDTNKRIEAYTTYDVGDAFNMGYILSEALQTDLLDATTHGDFKLIDKVVYRETGEIKHID